jgi:hypothetical protein
MIVKFELHQRQHFSDHLVDVKRNPFSAVILEYRPNAIDYIARPVAIADNRLESSAHLYKIRFWSGQPTQPCTGTSYNRR